MRLILLAFFITLLPINAQAQINKGTGLISSDLQGALPKALWRDQPRSEITYLLKNLPADSNNRTKQIIKRNMLLSVYDTGLIKNDVEPKVGEDLLTLRLQKLVEMGLWDEAFSLYTKNVADPGQNSALAQVGITLILLQKGLSTACLEEKVLSPRFEKTKFWSQIDVICGVELGTDSVISTSFPESSVLLALYNESGFKISANAANTLNNLSQLELAMVIRDKKIDYQVIDFSQNYSPYVLKSFMSDARFPEGQRESLDKIAYMKGILTESPHQEGAKPSSNDTQSSGIPPLLSSIATKLRKHEQVTREDVTKLEELAQLNSKYYIYIQILNALNGEKGASAITPEQSEQALEQFSEQKCEKLNYLKSLLDKPSQFSNNRRNVYEKQLDLTQNGEYVKPIQDYANWLKETTKQRFAGLALLIILSNVDIDAGGKDGVNTLTSLRTVGLIDQAHLIAGKELADVMGSN